MSYFSMASRRLLGEQYDEVKGKVLDVGASAIVSALPNSNGAPTAVIDHQVTLTDGQKMFMGAAVFLLAFYVFWRKG